MSDAKPKLMKVYNLTDVSTKVLKARGLENQHIALGGRMIDPGQYVEVEDTVKLRDDAALLVQVGALSIGSVPPAYAKARSDMAAAAGGAAKHVEIKETALAPDVPAEVPAEAPAESKDSGRKPRGK